MTGIVMGSGGSGGSSLPRLSNPAAAGHILQGREAIDGKGNKISGSIISKTAATYVPGTEAQVIPAGQYLSGNQTIEAVQTQRKMIPPAESRQFFYPDSGKFFSEVQVYAVKIFYESIYFIGNEISISLPFSDVCYLAMIPLELNYGEKYDIVGTAFYNRDGSNNISLMIDTDEECYMEEDMLEWSLSNNKTLTVSTGSTATRFSGNYLVFAYGTY